MKSLTKKQQKMLWRIIAAGVILIVLALISPQGWLAFALYMIPYLLIGFDVLLKAARNICNGQVFDENFLMSLATVGALATGEYAEAVFVMLFYQVGELFQSYAVDRSRRSIAKMMEIRPDYAHVERDGKLIKVDPEELCVGDEIVVQPGERVPLDGKVLEGESLLDTAALTGESMPRAIRPGEHVLSGCINQTGVLRVEVEKEFEDSTVSKILELVENAGSKKAKAEHFITKFARWYTPAVVILALLLALIPPIFVGGWADWLRRALIFLVISCPCALVISVPLSFFGGIGGASKQGILVKGGNYLEVLAKIKTVVMDKTGTLTEGRFSVQQISSVDVSQEVLLEWAALAESYSTHPIAICLREAWNGEKSTQKRVAQVEEYSGKGVKAEIDGKKVYVGNLSLMEQLGISVPDKTLQGTAVYVAVDGQYQGCITVADTVKASAVQAIHSLKKLGVQRVVMLTGDRADIAQNVARTVGVDDYFAQLLPGDKVLRVEQLIESSQAGSTAFVGDGINDAPVLSRADVGIAMGAIGSDAAIEAADVVLMDDDLRKLPQAIKIARKTLRIVQQNIIFALGVKGIVLVMGAFDVVTMWEAVFADVGVSVIAILNAMRALKSDQSVRKNGFSLM